MKKLSLFLAVFFTLCSFSACSGTKPEDVTPSTPSTPVIEEEEVWTGGEIYDGIAYITNASKDQTMDVYVPGGDESYPLIVMLHGGMFKFGDSKMPVLEPAYSYFRDNGYVCASINYTLGENTYPQAIIDCKSAIQYLVDNADTYKVDASNITIMGESAGAYIAVMSAISGQDTFTPDGVDSYNYDVKNLVDLYGPIYPSGDGALSSFIGGNTELSNPADHFTTGNSDLNVWIQHGTADTSVDYTLNSDVFAAELESASFNVVYSTIEGATHMDSAFYTDDNLAAIDSFIKSQPAVSASVASVYTCSEEKSIGGNTIIDTYEITLNADGTATLSCPGAMVDILNTVYTGTYVTNEDGSITISDLKDGDTVCPGSDAMPGFSFVVDGSCTITVADDSFAPVQ